MLTILFCIGDLTTVLGGKTGFPFIQIFYDSVGNVAGATTMAAVVLALTWACAIGITTTASRMTWSFARDRGTPFSSVLMKVEPRTQVPIIAVGAVTMFAALLTLIYIGSTTAFNDVISLTITGFYGSYFLPCAFLYIIGSRPSGWKECCYSRSKRFYGRSTKPEQRENKEVEDPPSKPDAQRLQRGFQQQYLRGVHGISRASWVSLTIYTHVHT